MMYPWTDVQRTEEPVIPNPKPRSIETIPRYSYADNAEFQQRQPLFFIVATTRTGRSSRMRHRNQDKYMAACLWSRSFRGIDGPLALCANSRSLMILWVPYECLAALSAE